MMRKPETIERLYLDFDGFFASVMQQCFPALRGRPVGVTPFDSKAALSSTFVIACSREAKAQGCHNVMAVPDAIAACPDIVLVPQRPDLYRRAHNALINEIACEIPIDAVKSIDELTCKLDRHSIDDPHGLSDRIKTRLRDNIGPHITCSIGYAANRVLAKIACKIDKPNGSTVWRPDDMPAPLLSLPLSDVPGIGSRMEARLAHTGILNMADILATQPKQLRKLWGNVNGERIWYCLHGYDLQAVPTEKGMYGHGRVLPPDWRGYEKAQAATRMLLTKAARRMRRDKYYANRLNLWLSMKSGGWSSERELHSVNDDQACLKALTLLWDEARGSLPPDSRFVRVGVALTDLTMNTARQLDMFLADDLQRQKWESVTDAIDTLNRKYGERVVTLGEWVQPPGGFAGGKIAFTRIPSAEDFL